MRVPSPPSKGGGDHMRFNMKRPPKTVRELKEQAYELLFCLIVMLFLLFLAAI